MKLLLHVLKLCFWALPAQRLCTIAGLSLMALAALWLPQKGLSTSVLLWAINGLFIAFLPAMVAGGPLWRAMASQRQTALAPHGRLRLLLLAFAIALLCALVMSTYIWTLYLWLPVPWRSFAGWLRDVGGYFAFASLWAMASFLAARSLLATFTVLLVLLGGGLLLDRLDLPMPDEWLPGGGLPFILLCWIVFGAWYLRAWRIAPSAWTSRRAEDEARVTPADTGGISARITRTEALRRLLLGGRSVGLLIMQCVLALGLLQVILVLIRVVADVPPAQVAPLHYFALALVLPTMAAISWLVAARLRSLWLTCRGSRAELFALGEGTLLMLAAGVAGFGSVIFVALWTLLPPPGSASSAEWLRLGLGAVTGAVLLPVYAALMRNGVAAVAALVVALVTLEPTYMHAFVYGEPAGSPWWLALLAMAIVALRERARRRWLHADMPRAAATAPAS
ncbi:MAG TPA: hypothetical protein VNQ32_09125 [Steroidobacteraceae bacterium]|nr:hypothetical protein [Steroidobacteraceae bacterium]